MSSFKTLVFGLSLCLLAACQPKTPEQTDESITDTTAAVPDTTTPIAHKTPCDNPQTVDQLLACAGTLGEIDSSWVHLGSEFNGTACLKAWADDDTALTIVYKDSIKAWRVGQWEEVPGKYGGHWFTYYSAKAAGKTKAETADLFALNNCSDFVWDSCICNGTILPPDTIIQYEDQVKIGGGQRFRFGIAGPNRFGKGGGVQWHLMTDRKPPFRLLKQEKW